MTYRFDLSAIVPYGRESPSSRVRVYEWLDRTPFLSEVICFSDVSTTPVSVLRGHLKRSRLRTFHSDRVLLHREASPLGRGELEGRLLRQGRHSVYDLDDALMWDFRSRSNLMGPKYMKARAAAAAADVVIAGNWTLAEWASTEARDVRVIPSCVDPEAYVPKASYVLHDPPIIGWLGSRSTEQYLKCIAAPLRALNDRFGARVLIIGANQGDLGPLETITDRLPWSLASQAALGGSCDIAVMPLDRSAYAAGKCGYKLLQYAAMAIPAVASPAGVNAQICHQLGYPSPSTAADWLDAMSEVFAASPEARRAMGTRAQREVATHFSFARWQAEWTTAVGA